MKYLVASDIHGSLKYAQRLLDIYQEEKASALILLGDLYYHGPRNPLPDGYNPMEVSKLFNSFSGPLYVVRGNCDAEVDEMISTFKFSDHIELNINDKKYYFTHGHHENIDNIPSGVDILVYGHFHTGFIKEKDGVICINSGSTTLPKNNTKNSYLIIDNQDIYLKDLERNIIDSIKVK